MLRIVAPHASMALDGHPYTGLASAASDVVEYPHRGMIMNRPPGLPGTQAKIDIFTVHEEPIIEATDIL